MKYLIQLCRILLGVTFIISGMIKLNDPMGFSFKLEDYFAPDVLNMPFFVPYTLTFAILVCIFEVVLGVTLLVGYKKEAHFVAFAGYVSILRLPYLLFGLFSQSN